MEYIYTILTETSSLTKDKLEVEITCPCGNKALLTESTTVSKYKIFEIEHLYYYYTCNECGDEYTTTESNNLSLNDFANKYLKKYYDEFKQENRT